MPRHGSTDPAASDDRRAVRPKPALQFHASSTYSSRGLHFLRQWVLDSAGTRFGEVVKLGSGGDFVATRPAAGVAPAAALRRGKGQLDSLGRDFGNFAAASNILMCFQLTSLTM